MHLKNVIPRLKSIVRKGIKRIQKKIKIRKVSKYRIKKDIYTFQKVDHIRNLCFLKLKDGGDVACSWRRASHASLEEEWTAPHTQGDPPSERSRLFTWWDFCLGGWTAAPRLPDAATKQWRPVHLLSLVPRRARKKKRSSYKLKPVRANMSHWLFPRARARQIKTCNRFPFQGGFASGFVSKAADACKAKMLVVFVYLLSC